jgi:hypothetical protein
MIRNAHTAWLDPVGAILIRAIPCGAAMPGSLETGRPVNRDEPLPLRGGAGPDEEDGEVGSNKQNEASA